MLPRSDPEPIPADTTPGEPEPLPRDDDVGEGGDTSDATDETPVAPI